MGEARRRPPPLCLSHPARLEQYPPGSLLTFVSFFSPDPPLPPLAPSVFVDQFRIHWDPENLVYPTEELKLNFRFSPPRFLFCGCESLENT